jgi:hypothetical protein
MHTYYVGQIKEFLLNLLILLNSISMGKIHSKSNSANKAFRLSKIVAPLIIILYAYKHQNKARIHPTEKKIIKFQLNTIYILNQMHRHMFQSN